VRSRPLASELKSDPLDAESAARAVLGDHLHHLAVARDQFGQGLAVDVGERAWLGTVPFAEQGDNLGIERIGLGEPAGGAGEITDLAWVDHGERKSHARQSGGHGDLEPLYADGGSQGAQFLQELKRVCRQINGAIVKRSDAAKGFAVLPKRWIVERTIAWCNRCHRLATDWECLNHSALCFLRRASIRLMVRKLCQ
jgi:transposase